MNAAPVKTVSDVKKTVEKLAQTGLPAAIALLAAAAVLGLGSIALRKRAKWAERHLDD